jgi:uncharacterized protein
MTNHLLRVGCFVLVLGASACGSNDSQPGESIPASTVEAPTQPTGFTSQNVTFSANGLETAGTLTIPRSPSKHPAVLFIAGSGPTDRNGDTPAIPGPVGTLGFLAESIASDAVTLRFDKLGVGKSQMTTDPAGITLDDFTKQAEDAIAWLASQPSVDAADITVAGHSEGGLIALKLGATKGPKIRRLALFSPPGAPYLSVIRSQLAAQVSAESLSEYDRLASELKTKGDVKNVPSDPVLASIFNESSVRFLANADTYDPVVLATSLPKERAVLLSCGERDVQVPCASLDGLKRALTTRLTKNFTNVALVGTNHVLRVTGTQPGGPETYVDASLPHSGDAAVALRTLVFEK